ncbi:MAG: hypothetical protein U0T69_03490 [Chitinophagales bacterium]
MKKILVSIIVNCITFYVSNAQPCNSTKELADVPTLYKKEYESAYKPNVEQEKVLSSLFTSVVEPALKNTKGLKGNWSPLGGSLLGSSKEGLVISEIEMYLSKLSCKENKITSGHESGLVITLRSNALAPAICDISKVEINKESSSEYVYQKVNGNQVYALSPISAYPQQPALAYYVKTDDAEYFVVAKKVTPLLVPISVQQALELNRNYWKALNIDISKTAVETIDTYLKETPAITLNKPANSMLLSTYIESAESIQNFMENDGDKLAYIINPAYINTKTNKTAPQFICVEVRRQTNDAVTQKAYQNFIEALNFGKLEQLLGK